MPVFFYDNGKKINPYLGGITVKPTKMTSKGQITLPHELRKKMGLQPGDKVEIAESPCGYIIKKHAIPSPFTQYVGFLQKKRRTDDVMEELRDK
jgi:AbrB family looped-hinge helix DNA binding protein